MYDNSNNHCTKLPKPSDIIKLVFDGVLILFMNNMDPVVMEKLTVNKKVGWMFLYMMRFKWRLFMTLEHSSTGYVLFYILLVISTGYLLRFEWPYSLLFNILAVDIYYFTYFVR